MTDDRFRRTREVIAAAGGLAAALRANLVWEEDGTWRGLSMFGVMVVDRQRARARRARRAERRAERNRGQ